MAGRLGKSISAWAITGVSASVATVVFFLLGTATGDMTLDHVDVRTGVLTGVLLVAGNGCFYSALARGTMGVIGGITATLVLVPVFLSLTHGATLSEQAMIGVAVTVGAAILLGAPEMRGNTQKIAVLLAVLAAVFYGFGEVADDVGAANNVYGTLMVMELTAATIVGVMGLITRSTGGLRSEALPTLVLVGLFNAAGWACFAQATTLGSLAVVSVLSSLAPVVLTVLAFFFLHEKLKPIQIVALGGVLVGSMLVSLG